MWRKMLIVATRADLSQQVAQAHAGLGLCLYRAARLDEAVEFLEQAAKVSGADRIALSGLAEIAGLRGDHALSLSLFDRLARLPPISQHGDERQHQAIVSLGRARAFLELGRYEEASEQLSRADTHFPHGSRMRIWCAATRALLEARLGQKENARSIVVALLRRLPSSSNDRSTLTSVAGAAAWTWLALGEYAKGREAAARYFAARPDPVWRPRIEYCDGLCALGLGDREAAVAAFRRAAAVSTQLDYARKAQKKLDEISAAT